MKPDCHFIEGKEEDAAPFSSPEKVRNILTIFFTKIATFLNNEIRAVCSPSGLCPFLLHPHKTGSKRKKFELYAWFLDEIGVHIY